MDAPPSLWIVLDSEGRPEFAAAWRDGAHDHIKDAIEIEVDETAPQWVVREYVPAEELTRLRAEVEALKATLTQQCKGFRADVEKLEAEVEALRADAERYRWLKDHSAYTTVTPCIHGDAIGPSRMRWYHDSHQLHAFTLDAAIDAARAAQGVKP